MADKWYNSDFGFYAGLGTAALLLEVLSYVTAGEHNIGADTKTSVFFIDDYRMAQILF